MKFEKRFYHTTQNFT